MHMFLFTLTNSSTFDLLPSFLPLCEATIYGVQLALINGVVLVANTYDAINACGSNIRTAEAYQFVLNKEDGWATCYRHKHLFPIPPIPIGDTLFFFNDDLLLPFYY